MSIYIQLAGGLGNQLFQYGAAILIQNAVGQKVFLTPAQENKHSGRDYRKELYGRIPHVNTVPPANQHVIHAYAEWDPDYFAECPLSLLIRGCYQHLPTFLPVLPTVLEDLGSFLSPYRDAMRQKYSLGDLSSLGFLHVRRGDYLTIANGTVHPVQHMEYYTKAVKHVDVARWLVLSNDVEWCRGERTFSGYEIIDEPDELYGLALMSLCHGGAIIANSTYSWWGAMLGANAAGAPVVYPSNWTAHEDPQLFPSHWIRL